MRKRKMHKGRMWRISKLCNTAEEITDGNGKSVGFLVREFLTTKEFKKRYSDSASILKKKD